MADNESTDISEIEARYRAQVAERYNRLSLTGLPERDPGLHDVSLQNVFIKLNTEIVQSGVLDDFQRGERQRLELEFLAAQESRQPMDRRREAEMRAQLDRLEAEARKPQTVTVSVADALHQHRHLVVVGGPGSGKTTLTRWLALRFAQGSQADDDALGPQFAASRLPILLELRRFADRFVDLSRNPGVPDLSDEIANFISTHAYFPDIPADFIRVALAEGRCIVLVDGLDEIADARARQAVAEALTAFLRRPDRGYRENLCIVTSRPHGFSDVTLPGFQTSWVQPFAPEDVDIFVHHWYATAYGLEAENETQELLTAVHANDRVLELATNPLLCTIIAIVYRNNRVLPNRRVALYLKCCEALLDTWERNKAIRESGLIGGYDWQTKLELLAPLAYWLHKETERLAAPEEALAVQLAGVLQEKGLVSGEVKALNEARVFLTIVRDRSGLLQGRGDGSLEFAHRTFQEYLAARHIAAQQSPYLSDEEYDPDKPNYIDLVMEHLHEAWWREVNLLVIGHLGSGSEGTDKASRLLQRILDVYPLPWRLLRSTHFDMWVPVWLNNLVDKYAQHRILKWPVYGLAYAIILPLALPALTRGFVLMRTNGQWERRLAWMLAREFTFAATGFFDCAPLGISTQLRQILAEHAQNLLLAIVRDPGRLEDGDATPLKLAARGLGLLVSALLSALGDSDWRVRQETASSLGLLGQATSTGSRQASEDVVSALLSALGDSDWRVRQAAARSLGKLGQTTSTGSRQASEEVVSALLSALGDSDWRVRQAAASSLGQLGQPSGEVVPALLSALGDSDWFVQQAAARSLGKLGQPSGEVVSALLSALGDSDWPMRQAAASSLGQLGQPSREVVSALLSALGDSDWPVRQAAASSLVQLGQASGEVVSALVSALGDSDWRVQRAAASSLGQLGQATSTGSGQASGEVVSALLSVLGDSDWRVQRAAASSLGQLGLATSTGSGQASGEVVSALVSALGDSSGPVRQAAASSLVQLGQATSTGSGQASREVVSALVSALGDSSGPVRQAAASSLVQLGQASGEVVSALLSALGDSSGPVRQAAASSLVQLGQATSTGSGQASGEVVSALVSALGDSDSDVRQAAADILGQLKIEDESQLRRFLLALNHRLHDGDDDVRLAALTAIRRLLDGRQIPGYRWVPIRVRRERAHKRRILGYWVLGISTAVLVAWVAAGLTTYLSLDEFWVRFVGALAALVALAAGGVQVLGWFRRPPWDQ